MPTNVHFSDEMIEMAKRVAPAYKFSKFAQMAVREEINRRLQEIQEIPEITERIIAEQTARASRE